MKNNHLMGKEPKIKTEVIKTTGEVLLLQNTKAHGGQYFEVIRCTLPVRHSNYNGFLGYALFWRTANKELAFLKFDEAKLKSEKLLKKWGKISI